MQLQFSDSYIVAVVALSFVLCFARNMLQCTAACLECLQQLCVCCDPSCLGYNAHIILRNLLRQTVVCFCFLQPVVLSVIVVSQRHHNDTAPASLTFCQTDLLPSPGGTNHTNVSAAVTCTHTDSIFVMLPYAVMTSINTLSWVSLTQQHALSPDTTWDSTLFDSDGDVAVILYESGYYAELWLLNLCVMANSVQTADYLQLFYAVQALTLCLLFYVTCARFELTHAADHCVSLVMLAYMSSILLPFWAEMLDTSCTVALVYGMVHAFALFMLGFGHYLAAGRATVAYVLSLRIVITVVVATTNLVVLALGSHVQCK
jgi:hypothetical protein